MLATALRLLKESPQAALQAIADLADDQHRDALISQVLAEWAIEDAAAALKAARNLASGGESEVSLVLRVMAQQDHRGALLAAEELRGEYPETQLMKSVVDGWGQVEPRDAIGHLQILGPSVADKLTMSVVSQYLQRYSEGAMNWRLNQAQPDPSVVLAVGVQYASLEMDSALDLTQNLPAGLTRTALLEAITRVKSRHDPESALQRVVEYRCAKRSGPHSCSQYG